MTRYRWVIAWFLFLGVVINYIDRGTLSVVAPIIKDEFHFGPQTLGFLLSVWGWGYVAMMLPGSWLGDRVGVHKMYTLGNIVWGIVQIATGAVRSVAGFAGLRALLGIAEAPAFPLNSQVMSKWFARKERALAVAIYDSGGRIGPFITPLLGTFVMVNLGWRWVFYITGALALLWGIGWYALYRDPWNKRNKDAEIDYISKDGAQTKPGQTVSTKEYFRAWGTLFRRSNTWGLVVGNFVYIYGLYLFIGWLPTYLYTYMHVPIVKTGILTSLPFFISWIAEIVIALWANRLIKRGANMTYTRKMFMIAGFVITASAGLLYFTDTLFWAMVIIIISNIGTACTAANLWSLPADLAPEGMGSSLSGIMNTFGFIASIIGPLITGYLLAVTHSFVGPMLLMAFLMVVGIVAVLLCVKKVEERIVV